MRCIMWFRLRFAGSSFSSWLPSFVLLHQNLNGHPHIPTRSLHGCNSIQKSIYETTLVQDSNMGMQFKFKSKSTSTSKSTSIISHLVLTGKPELNGTRRCTAEYGHKIAKLYGQWNMTQNTRGRAFFIPIICKGTSLEFIYKGSSIRRGNRRKMKN